MSTAVFVNTRVHAVTHVTEKMIGRLKDIIRLSGLDPTQFVSDRDWIERGIRKWLETEDLEKVVLEVFNPKTDKLVGRWDFEIFYNYSGDGSLWVDPDLIKYHIAKQGLIPSSCSYRIVTTTKPGRPDVQGWSRTTLRSTDGFVRQSIGTTIDGSGLSTGTGYWRKAS